MSLQCDNLSGELQDQWSSSFYYENHCEQGASPYICIKLTLFTDYNFDYTNQEVFQISYTDERGKIVMNLSQVRI